jgi:hypothetical protein
MGTSHRFVAADSEAHHSVVGIFFGGVSADDIPRGSLLEWWGRHNNGMHPTRFSMIIIRQIEGLSSCMRAGDARRYASEVILDLGGTLCQPVDHSLGRALIYVQAQLPALR